MKFGPSLDQNHCPGEKIRRKGESFERHGSPVEPGDFRGRPQVQCVKRWYYAVGMHFAPSRKLYGLAKSLLVR